MHYFCFPSIGALRSPGMWQYPAVITPTAITQANHAETSRSNSVTQSSDSMSNGSATPPTAEHSQAQAQPQVLTNGVSDASKFIFPQSAIPISPGIFGSPAFFNANGTSGVTPMTPTLLTPATAIGLSEPYLRTPGQIYSPFTLGPPIPGSLPKTPTLPPPSPHAIVGGAFPLASQGLPTSATLVNSPFGKGTNVMDEIARLGFPVSPFIMSPGPGFSPKKTNGGTTVFFPTTITANGDAKLTPISSFTAGAGAVHLPDGSPASSVNSPIVKLENGHPSCCVGEDSQAA